MLRTLGPQDLDQTVAILCEAFRDYPVMRFVLQDSADYDADLRTLVHFFASVRFHREEVLLGTPSEGALAGVALLSYPGRGEAPPETAALREETWARVGNGARARYETFGAAAGSIEVGRPHIHLNMIGVVDGARGTGLGRRLLQAVHAMSARDPDSEGVSLSTENPGNVPLYRHFGYEVLGEADVAGAFTTWVMFRPD